MDKDTVGISSIQLGVEVHGLYGKNSIDVVEASDADFAECPNCKSPDIEYDINGIEPESVTVYRVHKCNKCGTSWDERYDLVSVTISKKEE